MALILAGSFVLSPTPAPEQQAGKITNKITSTITKTILDDAKEKRKQIDNPNYKPKKKLPIIAGYKPGKNPMPKGTTPAQTYKGIWDSFKAAFK